MVDWSAFDREIGDAEIVESQNEITRKSRDFYWYSPVLKAKLDDCVADRVVIAKSEADVIGVAHACVRQRIPLTVRGGGTGNYGQAVPVRGGVVLDMTGMGRVLATDGAMVRAEAGAIMKDIDDTLAPDGRELRMHPSTVASASIGGFVGGGAVGVGGITYGRLRDRGNILGVKIVTMEDEPRVIELTGDDVQQVHQAWGTNGIITEVTMPVAPKYDWIEGMAAFETFEQAAGFCQRFGEADGIIKKLDTLLAWPIVSYFKRFNDRLPDGGHIAVFMVAAPYIALFEALVRENAGEVVLLGRLDSDDIDGPPLYEYCWNHTTLYGMRADPAITYIQALFPAGRNLELMSEMRAIFGDEVMIHAEFQRIDGRVLNSALQLVRYTTEERLNEIMDIHVANGVGIANPHTNYLDDSYKRVSLEAQLGLKRRTDPYNLLNPGKIQSEEITEDAAE